MSLKSPEPQAGPSQLNIHQNTMEIPVEIQAELPPVDLYQESYNNQYYCDPHVLDSLAEIFRPSRVNSRAGSPLPTSLNNETYGPSIADVLRSLDDPNFYNNHGNSYYDFPSLGPTFGQTNDDFSTLSPNFTFSHSAPLAPASLAPANEESHLNFKPANDSDKLALATADQRDGSRDERLARVIHAKFEAGLLKPYNHVQGYQRLMRWMESNMSEGPKQRTLQVLSEFRPMFRAIAASLTDLDLIIIEESFERLLLDYDRVFSTMGVPACLWRRTGEIYKGNKEFADLVGVPIEKLREGKLGIYELMEETSAASYWEKYGEIAFQPQKKAVLTRCNLVDVAFSIF